MILKITEEGLLFMQKKKEEAQKSKVFLESKEITLKVKVGAGGKVFGAITSKEIVEEIEKVFKIKIEIS